MFLAHLRQGDQISTDMVELLSKSNISNYDEKRGVVQIRPNDEMGYHYLKNNLGNSLNSVSDYFKKYHGIENVDVTNPASGAVSGEKSRSIYQNPAKNEKKEVFMGSLNSRYTFESFVIGESNNFAYAAAMGCVRNPGEHNPLFIRGASGLGKTHLMNAIGNEMLEKEPSQNICCLSSEQFTNLVVEYISKRNMETLRRKLRNNCDILMIDDIQFIQEKRSTQEEFFHTFNALYDAGKQIVVTSDKVPEDMVNFEERMISRFLWGLIADIRPPDIETRAAIIKKKAEERKVEIPQGVVDMISEKVRNNVRELEGVLTKLVVFAEAADKPIDIRTVMEVLSPQSQSLQRNNGKSVNFPVDIIKATIEGVFNLKKGQLESPQRTKTVVFARQIAMYLIRKHHNLPYTLIGNEFGKRDHSTVMHAVSKIETAVEQNEEITKSAIKEVEDRMKYN